MGKTTWDQRVQCVLFALFLGGMSLLYWLLPKKGFSELEKRELAAIPAVGADFGENMETYMADHLPGRGFFLGVGAYWDLFTGRQSAKEIYPARGNRLVEAPAEMGRGLDNIDYVNQFRQNTGLSVDLLLVPSAGFALEDSLLLPHRPYEDGAILQQLYEASQASPVDVTTLFLQNPEALYYRTDHHWTSLGAFTACNAYLRQLGLAELEPWEFEVQTIPDFYGTTYCRSCLWLTPGEDLEIWQGSGKIEVEGASALFDMDKAASSDKYTVFLGGNQSLVRLKNEAGQGKILVLRDSYGSSFAPFLAQSFAEVILVDLRYYKNSVSRLCQAEEIDRVLVLYSLNNFLSDRNLVFLQ